jgi:hypothetical protein
LKKIQIHGCSRHDTRALPLPTVCHKKSQSRDIKIVVIVCPQL